MQVQIVTFQLAGLSEADYIAHTEARALAFKDLPGLIQKVWLADAATNTYGGAYVWASREDMERYEQGEIFAGLRSNPGITNLQSRSFEVLDVPTAVTSDLLKGAAMSL